MARAAAPGGGSAVRREGSSMQQYDLVVIGTGPAGQKAAVQASKLGKRVCIVEKTEVVGGSCLHYGTIPSKALREAVLNLLGRDTQTRIGRTMRRIGIDDLIYFSAQVIKKEMAVIRDQMYRNGITMIHGTAHFEGDPHNIVVDRSDGSEQVSGRNFLIATGTRPARPDHIPFNQTDVVDSDSLLSIDALPKSLIIVGGGVIGTEYACILASLGVRVTLVEARSELLEFADREIIEALQYQMRMMDITLRLGERVEEIELHDADGHSGLHHHLVEATLESGKHLKADTLLYCVGRQGTAEAVGVSSIGLEPDHRGRLSVNERFQTAVEHVYACGDVIGFPALASTSMEQGRLAACYMFGAQVGDNHHLPDLFPYGIYSIPEISMVGKTESQLTEANVPYEVGKSRYKEIARGQLLGDEVGMLKLLVHETDRKLLGIHAIGSQATELIHIGQAVMALGGTVDYFIHNVFNYPTLAEAYKVAALNASNRMAYA